MIAFEVKLNGKRICIAGAEDLCVLSANVAAAGKLGLKTVPTGSHDDTAPDLFYSVGGLTRRPDPKKDVHLRWKSVAPLSLGDLLAVKVVEVRKADRPKSRKKAPLRPAKRRRA
jgi:hypothetical protein